MKFRFIGDPRQNGDGPLAIRMYGLVFVKDGDPVEVSDPGQAAKLAGNGHFEAPAPAEPAMPDPTGADMRARLLTLSKDDLEALALERYGANIDKRKSVEKLVDQIMDLEAARGDHEGDPS
jgi:hypothetical protein